MMTSAPGGSSDVVSRVLAQSLSASLGQQVIVENRGGGTLAGEFVARSSPDGYTLLYYGAALWLRPLMRKDVPYDPLRDFAPISLVSRQIDLMVVHPSLPVKSVKEVIALAQARPGALNYASGPTGSSGHLGGELFKYLTGVDIVRVNYKGQGPAMNDLVAGQVHLAFGTTGAVGPHVRTGRLRPLAVTGAQRSVLFPELPTIAASGVPGYELEQMSGLFAPARTPPSVIALLNQEIARTVARPEVRDRLLQVGTEVIASSPEQFAAKMRDEQARVGKMVRAMGIRED
jgi:tripartite-type tricarboxylate transporter receptor subunit TctC